MKAEKIQNLLSEIEDIVDQDYDDLQDWNVLYDWPLGETRRIGDTINTKVVHSSNHIRLITIILPGGGFPKHWHDVAEMCRVLAGLLKDLVTGMIWKRDELAIFSRGQKHIPVNPDKSFPTWLEVNFYKK